MNRIFTLIVFISFTFLLKAQEESDIKKNDISIKIGFYTAGAFGDFIDNFGFHFLGNTKRWKTDFPLLFINYKRSINQRWDIEGLLGYEKYSTIIKDSRKYQKSSSFTGIGLGVNFNYIKRKDFQIYSGLNSVTLIAFTTEEEKNISEKKGNRLKEREFLHCVHITAFGIRFGDRFAVNSEIGIGYKGLFNMGASYRF